MHESKTDVVGEIARLRDELAELKRSFADNAQAASLPLVELLLRDNARRSEAEQQLEFAQSWMQLAQQAGGVAAYHMDLLTGELFWSASAYKLYGLNPALDRPTLDNWLGAMHPDDREGAHEVAMAAIHAGTSIDHEFRLLRPDGTIRWIRDRGRTDLDVQGRPVRVVGMNIDVTGLKEVQAALSESEAQFRYTFEHAQVGVAHVALDGTFMEVNQYFCELLGRPRDELMNLTYVELTHAEDVEADIDHVDQLLKGQSDHYKMEKRYIRPDGTSVWAELSVSLRRTPEGNPAHFIAVVTDIQARKHAEEQVSIVLREAQHRCGNLLAVMSALIHMSAKTATTVETLRDALLNRLQGLSASQNLLFGKDLCVATLGELVTRQAQVFSGSESDRITMQGPAVALAPDWVHAIGLVLHELCTNACKYGALSTAAGRVDVAWSMQDMGRVLHISWAEREGPAIPAERQKGFGSHILERSLEVSLGAKSSLRFDPQGVRYDAWIPLCSS